LGGALQLFLDGDADGVAVIADLADAAAQVIKGSQN
jgi:hypothetical protein